jgi:hypothetical protein
VVTEVVSVEYCTTILSALGAPAIALISLKGKSSFLLYRAEYSSTCGLYLVAPALQVPRFLLLLYLQPAWVPYLHTYSCTKGTYTLSYPITFSVSQPICSLLSLIHLNLLLLFSSSSLDFLTTDQERLSSFCLSQTSSLSLPLSLPSSASLPSDPTSPVF